LSELSHKLVWLVEVVVAQGGAPSLPSSSSSFSLKRRTQNGGQDCLKIYENNLKIPLTVLVLLLLVVVVAELLVLVSGQRGSHPEKILKAT